MDTLQYVRACLDATDKPLKEIAEGAGVGSSWLRMFKQGHIPDPGYSRVKLLADYFLRTGCTPIVHDPQPQQVASHGPARSHMG